MAKQFKIYRSEDHTLRKQISDGLNELSDRLGGPDPNDPAQPFDPEYNFGAARWQGVWQPLDYYKDDMVYDDGWLMIANTDTGDRAAPQPTGEPFTTYEGASPTTNTLAKQIIFGQRYTSQNGAYVLGYRVYTVTGNTYRVFTVLDPEGTPVINEVISFTAATTGWQTFALPTTIVPSGVKFDLVAVVFEPDVTPITFNGDWDYQTPNNEAVPGIGVINHSTRLAQSFRINKTDANLNDRSADLGGLAIGDVINGAGQSWSIQTITDNGTWFDFTVAPALQGSPAGVQNFEFETVTATPIAYLKDVNYWPGSPFAGLVQGLEGIDTDYGSIVPDDNAYGTDLIVQAATVSDDWDLMAYTDTASSSDDLGGAGTLTNNILRFDEFWARFLPTETEALAQVLNKAKWQPGPFPTWDEVWRVGQFVRFASNYYTDIQSPYIISEVNYLETIGIIGPGRAAVILS